MAIDVFERIELKYVLSLEQFEYMKNELKPYMKIDQYGRTSISSIYYDTSSQLLVRRSIEKPLFKEKIRLRSYGLAKEDGPVFLELKRKYDGLVYKRRVISDEKTVNGFFDFQNSIGGGQIAREITYFRNLYGDLTPTLAITYERTALYEINGSTRVTFDENIRYRLDRLNLHETLDGTLLGDGKFVIMEIKCLGSMPLYLTKILSKGKIYKSSFSKYGNSYLQIRAQRNKLQNYGKLF